MKVEQKVVRLSIDGKSISDYIKDGWRVVIATPVLTTVKYSDSAATKTRYIEYILEREIVK